MEEDFDYCAHICSHPENACCLLAINHCVYVAVPWNLSICFARGKSEHCCMHVAETLVVRVYNDMKHFYGDRTIVTRVLYTRIFPYFIGNAIDFHCSPSGISQFPFNCIHIYSNNLSGCAHLHSELGIWLLVWTVFASHHSRSGACCDFSWIILSNIFWDFKSLSTCEAHRKSLPFLIIHADCSKLSERH